MNLGLQGRIKEVKEITFELTTRCSLRCLMCGIHRQPAQDLPLGRIKDFIGNFDGTSVSLTGGEPLLYPQIDELIAHLYERYQQKRVVSVHISSNGQFVHLGNFLKRNIKYIAPCSFTFSIDGIGKAYDRQRGKNGAFVGIKRGIALMQRAGLLKRLSLKMVITSLNFREIERVYRFAKGLGVQIYFKFVENVPQYYNRSAPAPQELFISGEEKNFVRQTLAGILAKTNNAFERFCLESLLRGLDGGRNNKVQRCNVPGRCLFVACNGGIYPCLYQPPIGSYFDTEGIDVSQWESIIEMGRSGACGGCLAYHGFLSWTNL